MNVCVRLSTPFQYFSQSANQLIEHHGFFNTPIMMCTGGPRKKDFGAGSAAQTRSFLLASIIIMYMQNTEM